MILNVVVGTQAHACVRVCVCLLAAEDKMGWHGKPLPKDVAESVIKELQGRIVSCNKRLYPAPPSEDTSPVSIRNIRMPSAPSYKPGDKVRSKLADTGLNKHISWHYLFIILNALYLV